MTGMTQRSFISIAILLAAAGVTARANSIDVSTGTANWTVSLPIESVSAVTPFGAGGGDGSNLCLSNTCGAGGTWVTGGGVAGFDGFWTAQLTFTIPAGATGVTLTYPAFTVDDRAVLELNGVIFASGSSAGMGEMELTDGGPNNPYTFSATPAEPSPADSTSAAQTRLKRSLTTRETCFKGPPTMSQVRTILHSHSPERSLSPRVLLPRLNPEAWRWPPPV